MAAPQPKTTPERSPSASAAGATRVKICGITRIEDAELAVELGAWAIGMIFYAESPRRCSEEAAELIAARLRRRTHATGVFVDAPLERVTELTERLGLDIVQLHGDEGPSYCAEVARRTGARVCKAVQVSGVGDLRRIESYYRVDYHLLDTRAPAGAESRLLRGGTGRTFDWDLLSQRRSRVPLILSGGLEPANVDRAIAATRPYAVDTASGTEASPGIKDPRRLRDFFAAVHRADADRAPDADGPPAARPASVPGDEPPGGRIAAGHAA